jgi:hypothetical protein
MNDVLAGDRPSVWARSTVEELMSRQVTGHKPCEADSSRGTAARSRDRGVFRPGLRVVALAEPAPGEMSGWLNHPAGVTIEG